MLAQPVAGALDLHDDGVVKQAGYGAGWQAGRTSARDDASILEVVLRQAGPEAEAALVSMVRANNLPVAWAQCRRSANPDKQGRSVCVMPMWAEPQGQPVNG
jgi:hypothetical protein